MRQFDETPRIQTISKRNILELRSRANAVNVISVSLIQERKKIDFE